MATPPKAKLIEKLKALRVTPPPNASSADLQRLLRQARALPLEAPERPPRPAAPPPAAKVPPAPASRPSFAVPAMGRLVAPAVPPRPVPLSDHDARPWDPHAGF